MAGPTAYDVIDRYDDAYFADLVERYRTRNRFARRRIANVFSLLPGVKGKSLLDVGCGMGTFTFETAARGGHAVGIDLMWTAMSAASRLAREESLHGAVFVQGDATKLPFASMTRDAVVAADLTEHLDDATLRGVLGEAFRVLKPHGVLILYTPSQTHIFERLRAAGIMTDGDPSHIGVRTAQELATFAREVGFTIDTVEFLPSHLPGLSALESLFSRWVPLLRRRIGIRALKPR